MPEQHMGTEAQWRANEARLGDSLTRNGFTWEINPGEGAFYGPKIEIYVPDALKRKWQVATIQLDYAASERFGLTYTASSGAEERPVVIHRAILGSLERFIGVLIEHTGGVLPFWLAPEQVRVLSLSEKVEGYANELTDSLKKAGYRAAADIRNEKLGFKVRDAELQKIPYMIVVGEREAEARSVSVRLLRGAKNESMSIEGLMERLKAEPLPA
jgi:threonyl-tRNA synthetase